MNSKDKIKEIIHNGTREDKLALFNFSEEDPPERIKKKFKLFTRACYPRFFQSSTPNFHDTFIDLMIASYFGENKVVTGYRGCAKTSLKKLFDTFVLLNDTSKKRKYIKVLSKDLKNSKQIVTDVYNLLVEVKPLYGDVFEKEGDKKREETMSSFTLTDGRKYSSGTVGQTQRGHVQDAYRPDWVWFEDVEDSESIRSAVITESVIGKVEEAINGLSFDGSYYVTGNYISDQGTIQHFINKQSTRHLNIPLLNDPKDNTSVTWDRYDEAKVLSIRKDTRDFWGEYQGDPSRSENKFFDPNLIDDDLRGCKEPKQEVGGVKYWGFYKPHHRYGIGSDHSEGIGLDSNTMCLYDFTTGELLATYANNQIAPDLCAHEFARVGREFGNCILAPEVNNKCGGIVITTLKNIDYPNIYQEVEMGKIGERESTKLGWSTTSKSKYNMFMEFRTDYNDGLIKIYDKNVLKEMKAYTNNDLTEDKAGLITRHFDLLTSAVIGWQMRKYAIQTTTKSSLPAESKYTDPVKRVSRSVRPNQSYVDPRKR